ncbi:MAG TPA: sensor histidine kinase, partial [Desulfovibrio sp.]|nr:sensor histidine kinase [Desulfovibrio sp.]
GEAPTGRVLLTVADNGPGLQGLEERVFDPFFTTKDPHKGLGLGLAIVHSFVESWGGEISVSGGVPPMSGAAFTLALRQASPPGGGEEAEGRTSDRRHGHAGGDGAGLPEHGGGAGGS